MELPELQQGLQDIGSAPVPPEAGAIPPDAGVTPVYPPHLEKDNFMQSYGDLFSNDAELGEVILQQLRLHNVDTKAATEAMVYELLHGMVDDLNLLQKKLSNFIASINAQAQKAQAVADSVQMALDSTGASATAQEILPPEGAMMPVMNDMPPDMGAAMNPEGVPPAGGDVPPSGGDVPPAGGDVPPADIPPAGGDVPPPADVPPAPADVPPPAEPPVPEPTKPTGSDRNIKDVKYVVSDTNLKNVVSRIKEHASKLTSGRINSNILSACNTGF